VFSSKLVSSTCSDFTRSDSVFHLVAEDATSQLCSVSRLQGSRDAVCQCALWGPSQTPPPPRLHNGSSLFSPGKGNRTVQFTPTSNMAALWHTKMWSGCAHLPTSLHVTSQRLYAVRRFKRSHHFIAPAVKWPVANLTYRAPWFATCCAVNKGLASYNRFMILEKKNRWLLMSSVGYCWQMYTRNWKLYTQHKYEHNSRMPNVMRIRWGALGINHVDRQTHDRS